jgi:metal-responsive CopG/Arc/MetJ family transcriptional regulator
MSKKVSITLDDEVLNFVDRLASNRSSFINDVLLKEKSRIFMHELEEAYKEQANDLELSGRNFYLGCYSGRWVKSGLFHAK